jgi:formate dehydrogenase gamma subunit
MIRGSAQDREPPRVMRTRAIGAIVAVAWAVVSAMAGVMTARGQGAPAAASGECLMCHSQPDLARSQPGRGGSLRVDPAVLAASPHASLACTACHTGATGMPHPERLPAVRCQTCHADQAAKVAVSAHGGGTGGRAAAAPTGRPAPGRTPATASCTSCHGTHAIRKAADAGSQACATCHGDAVRAYQASVHGTARTRGDLEAAGCRDCHGPAHAVRPHGDPSAPTSHDLQAETCARCHADRELTTRRRITIPEAYTLYKESVHSRSNDPAAATCSDCHRSHDLRRANDPAASIYKANVPETCGRCHATEARDYRESVHGTALARGVTRTPVCTDCHGEHKIRGPRDAGSPVAAASVTATCSHCHEATGIRETYGLPAGRLSTYQDSFHGLAARGGSPAVANCASCHGYHRILPSSDPRSAVAAANLSQTCGKCHPGAGERFAAGAVHVAMVSPDRPLLRWVRLAYLWLIALTIGGMALHNGMDFVAKMRRRLGEHLGTIARHAASAGRSSLRMTLGERIQHLALAVSFFTLVYTGFALKFPEGWPFAWLARLEGGYALRSTIHRLAAIVMIVTALVHVAYLAGRRGRAMLADMRPRLRDLRDALGNLLYLAGLRPAPPPFERFSYIEKAEYWALVWGTAVMTVTGLVLWFENQALQWLNKWVLDLATIVHYYEAWLAFLAIMVWHVYQTVLNPDVYPMNWTWITGKITDEQLRHEHAAEWERLRAERAKQDAAEADQPAGD